MVCEVGFSLVTSQNVTAPKLMYGTAPGTGCLVTSQNVTAPKRRVPVIYSLSGLVTSQNVTAPKLFNDV